MVRERAEGRGVGRREGGVPKRRSEGQDKPLCPHGGPRGPTGAQCGPGATDLVVSVSYFANPAIIFYPARPLTRTGYRRSTGHRRGPIRGPREYLIFCYLAFRIPRFHPSLGRHLCAAAPSRLRARLDRFLITAHRERSFSFSL
jgi:hypothetical protein